MSKLRRLIRKSLNLSAHHPAQNYLDTNLETYSEMDKEDYGMTAPHEAKEFFHAPYNLSAYLLTIFLKDRFDRKINILNHVVEAIWIQEDNFYRTVEMLVEKHGFLYTPANEQLIFQKEDCFIILQRNKEKEFDRIFIYAHSAEYASQLFEEVKAFDAQIKKLSFYWIVNSKGDSVDVVEEWEETVDETLYPFIDNFDTYAQRFLASKSNILILIGPPGTGKTTFIKHLMSAMDKKAYLTYDESVLSGDGPFADFISDNTAGSFIIEDADLFLKSRAEGNGMISRFLNIGDGLIKLKNKKLIFSTNLPSVRDMDAALIRPGRCFDILNFRSLTKVEAEKVANSRGLDLSVNQDEYTLAEIFNSPVATKAQKFGFI